MYTSVEDLVEELPDNSARFIVLSYPFKLPDGRLKSPLALLYWRPPTCGQSSKMLYAGAVELFRDKAGVSKYVYILHAYIYIYIYISTFDVLHTNPCLG